MAQPYNFDNYDPWSLYMPPPLRSSINDYTKQQQSNYSSHFNHDHSKHDYTKQEDEWNPMAVLDPLWEQQQKKTFLAWVNWHLRKAGTAISSLDNDFGNGLKLMLLIEVISGKRLSRPDRGRTRFHRIANVNKALDAIESRGVRLVSIGAEVLEKLVYYHVLATDTIYSIAEIVDGNVKIVLALIWSIILRFAIADIRFGDLTARDALLAWARRTTSPYKNVDVQNFGSSWIDGLAFSALIHRYRPDLLSYETLSAADPIDNLNRAFNVAERKLDIPRMLDAEDLVYATRPDEHSIMTYVSSFYHALNNTTPPSRAPSVVVAQSPPLPRQIEPIVRTQTPIRQLTPVQLASPPPLPPIVREPAPDPRDLEAAARRVVRALDIDRQNERLMAEYNKSEDELLKWIEHWSPQLADRADASTRDAAVDRAANFRHYRNDEKPPRIAQKSQLDTRRHALDSRLRDSHRAPFVSEGEKVGKTVNIAWQDLERAETGYESWLLSELVRLERVEHLAEKFRRKCALHESWSRLQEAPLVADDYRKSRLAEIKALQTRYEAFENEMNSQQERVEQIMAIAQELVRLRYARVDEVSNRSTRICKNWTQLGTCAKRRKDTIGRVERLVAQIDEAQAKFAAAASPFHIWIAAVQEDLDDMVIVLQTDEIKTLLAEHDQFKRTLPDAEASLAAMRTIEQNIKQLLTHEDLDAHIHASNPYTQLTVDQLDALWSDVQMQIPKRERQLAIEFERQKNNDRLRRSFVDAANDLGPRLERRLERTLELVVESENNEISSASLNTIMQRVDDLRNETQNERVALEKLEILSRELVESRIFDIPDAKYSMDALRVGWESLLTALCRARDRCDIHQLTRELDELSVEEQNDYRAAFERYDKDRAGLNVEQLRVFLLSTGFNSIDDSTTHRLIAQLTNGGDRVSWSVLLEHLKCQRQQQHNTSDHLCRNFRLLANGKNMITETQIRAELPVAVADRCLRLLDLYRDPKGLYNYEAFSRHFY